jgi:hypothetical protein
MIVQDQPTSTSAQIKTAGNWRLKSPTVYHTYTGAAELSCDAQGNFCVSIADNFVYIRRSLEHERTLSCK